MTFLRKSGTGATFLQKSHDECCPCTRRGRILDSRVFSRHRYLPESTISVRKILDYTFQYRDKKNETGMREVIFITHFGSQSPLIMDLNSWGLYLSRQKFRQFGPVTRRGERPTKTRDRSLHSLFSILRYFVEGSRKKSMLTVLDFDPGRYFF